MGIYEDVREEFASLPSKYDPEKAAGVDAVIEITLEGDGGGIFVLSLYKKHLLVEESKATNPDMSVSMPATTFLRIANQEVDPLNLAMSGEIKIDGDRSLGVRLISIIEGS